MTASDFVKEKMQRPAADELFEETPSTKKCTKLSEKQQKACLVLPNKESSFKKLKVPTHISLKKRGNLSPVTSES